MNDFLLYEYSISYSDQYGEPHSQVTLATSEEDAIAKMTDDIGNSKITLHSVERRNPWEKLKGQTITSIHQRRHSDSDDTGYLDIEFESGLKITLAATFDSYSGKSSNEYPTELKVIPFGWEFQPNSWDAKPVQRT